MVGPSEGETRLRQKALCFGIQRMLLANLLGQAHCGVSLQFAALHLGEQWLGQPVRRGRRHYDVPADHFTRYDLGLMRVQVARAVQVERVEGVSLGWGFPGWTRAVERLPAPVAQAVLRALDALARRLPQLADVVVLCGRPRQ